MRLLPLTMSALGLIVSLKAVEMFNDPEASSLIGRIASAQNASAQNEDAAQPEAKAEEEEKPKDDKSGKDKAAAEDPLDESGGKPKDILKKDCNFSDIELDILQSLSKRREEIQAEGAKLVLKENLIRATEARMDRKLGELKETRDEIDALMKKYAEKEQEKVQSLVKIYENMKAKEAARIFEQIDMDILLDVVTAMPERKLAPILAKMSPTRAKEVTQELAERRRLPVLQNAKEEKDEDPLNAPLPEEPEASGGESPDTADAAEPSQILPPAGAAAPEAPASRTEDDEPDSE